MSKKCSKKRSRMGLEQPAHSTVIILSTSKNNTHAGSNTPNGLKRKRKRAAGAVATAVAAVDVDVVVVVVVTTCYYFYCFFSFLSSLPSSYVSMCEVGPLPLRLPLSLSLPRAPPPPPPPRRSHRRRRSRCLRRRRRPRRRHRRRRCWHRRQVCTCPGNGVLRREPRFQPFALSDGCDGGVGGGGTDAKYSHQRWLTIICVCQLQEKSSATYMYVEQNRGPPIFLCSRVIMTSVLSAAAEMRKVRRTSSNGQDPQNPAGGHREAKPEKTTHKSSVILLFLVSVHFGRSEWSEWRRGPSLTPTAASRD